MYKTRNLLSNGLHFGGSLFELFIIMHPAAICIIVLI